MSSPAGAQPPPASPPATAKTGGGGGDQRPDFTIVATSEGPVKVWKRRKPMVTDEDFGFNPKSLVGSWFHRLENDAILERGVVIAEPAPQTYLIQIDRVDIGIEDVQRLVSVNAMLEDDGSSWMFYDSEERAVSAYAHFLATESERA